MESSEFRSDSYPHRNTSFSSSDSSGPSLLTWRYDIEIGIEIDSDCHATLPSRQNEFTGGPDVVVHGPDGTLQPAHQGGSRGRRGTASDTSDTRSVVSVYDLGLNSASNTFNNNGPGTKRVSRANETEGSIRERIENSLKLSKFDQQDYLPLDAFEDIFNYDSIKSLVSRGLPKPNGQKRGRRRRQHYRNEKLLKKVSEIWGNGLRKGRRRILAILIYMEALHYLDHFIKEDVSDDDLPLRRVYTRTCRVGFKTRAGTTRSHIVNASLMKDWTRNERDLFYVNQSRFCVPFFSSQREELLSHVFSNDVRLPWSHYKRITNGGNGVVYQLQIYPSHHDFKGSHNPRSPLYFAVKEIDSLNRETYHDEIRALEQTNAKAKKEKHLIELLLTFQHGDKLFLLFEWADGNLLEFWEKTPTRGMLTPELTSWVAKQCLGIATAVKRIHGLATWQKDRRSSASSTSSSAEKDYGRHGDIKPQNILWFSRHGEDIDLLVVSDLGLTRFHSRLTKSLVSRLDGYTGAYRAPEIEFGSHISQRYDVWSLGCVFLEFCVWYLLGMSGVRQFEDDRLLNHQSDIIGFEEDCFFVMTKDPSRPAELNPAVSDWIERLQGPFTRTAFSDQLLDLIKTKMLVINPGDRAPIDIVCVEIFSIVDSLSIGTQLAPPKTEQMHFATKNDQLFQHMEGGSNDAGKWQENLVTRPRSLSIPGEPI